MPVSHFLECILDGRRHFVWLRLPRPYDRQRDVSSHIYCIDVPLCTEAEDGDLHAVVELDLEGRHDSSSSDIVLTQVGRWPLYKVSWPCTGGPAFPMLSMWDAVGRFHREVHTHDPGVSSAYKDSIQIVG